jgi:hypothetical protein
VNAGGVTKLAVRPLKSIRGSRFSIAAARIRRDDRFAADFRNKFLESKEPPRSR